MKQIDEQILIQYIDQTLSLSEREAVECWLAADAANQKVLEQLYFTMVASERLQVMQSVNSEAALLRFKNEVRKKEKKQQIRRYLNWCQWVAAVLFIPLLLLSGFFAMQRGKQSAEWLTVKTNPGVVTSVSLPDGSVVWLNGNSELRYPSRFVADKREVELNGEGFFDVTPNKKQPFVVKADQQYQIEVLGTSFNVIAFADEDLIETTLVEGAVKLQIQTPLGQSLVQKLSPNQKAAYQKKGEVVEVTSVNPEYDTAWMNGELIFRNQPMERVLQTLERRYHVKFDIRDESIKQSIITARFKNEQLPQVLDYLKLASGIQYTIHKPTQEESQTNAYRVEITK